MPRTSAACVTVSVLEFGDGDFVEAGTALLSKSVGNSVLCRRRRKKLGVTDESATVASDLGLGSFSSIHVRSALNRGHASVRQVRRIVVRRTCDYDGSLLQEDARRERAVQPGCRRGEDAPTSMQRSYRNRYRPRPWRFASGPGCGGTWSGTVALTDRVALVACRGDSPSPS